MTKPVFSVTCAECEGNKDRCKCPSIPPSQILKVICEETPWASECKIYED